MAEEGVTPNEEVDEEEEEEEQSSDDRQTLDDLTVLTDTTSPLDDADEQGIGDDTLEWEEPAASQSLSTIHTGSRPTDAELMANLVPEGDVIIDEGEIVPPEEAVGAELPEVDAELPETEPDPEPVPEAATGAPPPPPAPPAPEEPVVEEEPEAEPVPEPEAAPDEAVQFAEAPAAAPPPPPLLPEEDDEEEDPDPEPEPEPEEVEVENAVGDEDTAIALAIDPGDAAEVLIEGVPDGAVLSAGTDNGNGTWTLTAEELEGLTITPPPDSDVDFTLSVDVEGEDPKPLEVAVNAVADAPTATAQDETGNEDEPVALNLTSQLTDTDLSEVLSVTLSIGEGVPEGTSFSAGTDNGDGTWTFTAEQLDGLTLTPPPNWDGEIPLTMTATSTELDGGDTATTTVPFTVTINPTGDFDFEHAEGVEDTAISLTIDPASINTEAVGLSDIPADSLLQYVDGTGATVDIEVVDGAAELSLDQLNGLQITPPPDSDVDFTLTVTANNEDEIMHVIVNADADVPTATAEDSVGLEDNPIDLDLSAALTDIDGSESLSLTIQGVPDGAILSAGTDNGDGSWSLAPGQLTSLTITPPVNFEGDIPLTLVATSTEADGGDFETTEVPFTVTVEPDLSKPDFEVTAAEGYEDNAIALDIDPGTVDVVTIGNVPTGAVLSAGTDNGDGTWTVDAGDLAGITITPPQDSDEEFTLSVTGTDVTGITQTLDVPVTVHAVADRPDLDVTSSIGDEDTSIPLTISSNLTDTDGSETLSLSIDIIGIPEGAKLTYVDDQGDPQEITVTDNSASLTQNQLNGLSITPPQDYYGDITLQVTSTSTETADDASPASAATTTTFGVTVRPVNDDPEVTVTSLDENGDPILDDEGNPQFVGNEDETISLNISAEMPDPTTVELSSVLLGGIEPGSTLTYVDDQGATQSINYTGSVAQLSEAQLNGLSITPPPDFNGEMDMTATAFSEDGGVVVTPFSVDVAAIADLDIDTTTSNDVEGGETTATVSGVEDTAIDLNISAASDEAITISSVPDGAELSAGTDNGNGTWTLTAADLEGLTITPPGDSDTDFDITVTAQSPDGQELTGTISVSVAADADAPSLDLAAASGSEDTAIPLTINTGLTDTDGSESLSINIGDIPTGSVLTYVDDQGATQTLSVTDGSVDLTADQLNGLQITPPADFSGDFNLNVTATTTEADGGDTAVTTGTLNVDVTGVADAPTLDLTTPATGTEDTAIALNISSAVTDSSETLSVTVSGVPTGASLSAGTDNGDGTWTLSADDLTGLTVTPPADSDVDFQLSVTATSTDGEDTATRTGTITVEVAADADTPTLDLTTPATGDEDTAIALNIDPGLTDTDGSESLSITIGGVPTGATLSAGTDNGDGTWTLTDAQLDGLTITPADNFDGTFDLDVTATATEADGGDQAVATGTLTVDGSDTATFTDALNVSVTGVADTPTLDLSIPASGDEDTAIPLNIQTGLQDLDGSETLSITIGNIPDGAVLASGGVPITISDGTAELTQAQLNNLTITPPADSSQDFTLSVATTSTEDDGDTATNSGTLQVSVAPDADTPTLDLTPASGTEDTAIPLNISTASTDVDGSESLSITIGDIPGGATLSYVDGNGDTQSITVTDGTADLTPEQLNGLSITPPADSDADFPLTVTSTATDGTDTATNSGTLQVSVAPDADAPTLGLTPATGVEDNAIPLSITADTTDGSETLSVSIAEIPAGATLSYVDGNGDTQSITVTNGTAELTPDQLNGLAITPPEDSDVDFTLDVTATSTDGTDTATTSGSLSVSVAADADAPTLNLSDAAGTEDNAIALNINPGLTDTDDSESLSVSIGDIPVGSTLTYVDGDGAPQSITVTNGSADLTPDQLNGLQITPPEDYSGSFDLSVTATSTEADGGDTASTSGTLTVDVAGDADAPTLDLTPASGVEDNAIPLSIVADTTDGSETLSVSIADIPAGATLSYVDGNGDTQSITVTNGTADLTPDQLNGLAITPPEDSDVDFALDVTATSTDGTDTATTSGSLSVSVAADADTPTLDLTDASGSEDRAIALDIDPGLGDTDGSESLSISIGDIPAGSTLTYVDGDGATQTITVTNGSADLTADQLNGLQITPPEDYSGSFDLSVTATATEADGGDTATTSGTLTVDVAAVADEADLTVSDASGLEDTAIPLSIDAEVTDSSETLSISISDIPDGATLTYVDDAGATQTITVAGGSADLTADQLNGLSITPPADSNEDFQLSVSATTTDGTDTETVTSALDVSVTGDADAPTATVQDETGTEDTWIQLNLDSALSDTDGSESLTITITDVPDGALLAPGTDNGDGTWSVTPAELPQVCILPPDDFSGEITMTLNVTATENDGDTETTSNSFNVTVEGDADAPTVTVSDASGTEDTAIPLSIDAALTDTSETLSITIGDIPQGATLTYVDGSNDTQTITVENGSADLTPAQLNGLQITPPADSNEDFQLSVNATSADGTDTATTTSTLDVSVTGDADAPTLDVSIDDGTYSSGGTPESDPVTVDIANDGALTFSGASSYGEIAYSTGEIEISADDSGTFNLQSLDLGKWGGDGIVVKAYDENGNEITSQSISMGDSYGIGGTVDFSDVSGFDGVHSIGISNPGGYIKVGDVTTTTGDADGGDAVTTYDLDVTTALTDTDGSETLSVTINDVPDGVSLSAGTDNGDGTWSVDPADLDGLEMTVPEGTEDFSVTVSATATENDGDTETTTQTIDVGSLDTVAETPTVSVDNAAGLEDGDIPITINAALSDTDGSETLSVTIGDVPDGATLSAGTDNGDGTWTIDPADLDGLSVTPPPDYSGSFDLGVTATATEADGGDTATASGTITVDVAGVADEADLTVSDATGTEDQSISLNIDAGVTDSSESLSITISGVPDGATLSAGTENQDGTWTLTEQQLDGLSVTPAADSDADFTLTVSATTTDGTDTETVSGTIDVSVAADADTLTLDLTDASGTEDNAIALDIDPGLTDTDGSESLSVTIGDIPDGATLTYMDGDGATQTITVTQGSATLGADQLNGLQITPADDYSGSFDLSVTATATEADGGDTATTTGTLTVDVAAVADEADLTVTDATGTEDQPIALDIDAGVTDASESLSITISGVPDGATLNAGTENPDGTWTLEAGDLQGLAITPPADSDADFTLSVTATSTDGSDTATTSGTIDVSVAADADAPTLDLSDASGDEETPIALNIDPGLTDTDGSESVSITISSVPNGATLSAGTENQDGTWILTEQQLDNLTITPADDYSGSFDLTVTATATEADGGDTATTSGTITVDVADVAEEVTLTLDDSTGVEDNAIALNIDTSGAEAASITISGVPEGATLSAGTENQDGTWALTDAQLDGLEVTLPADSDADFTLTVTATSADGTETTGTVDVTVTGDADAPTLSADATYSETEAVATTIDVPQSVTDAATGDNTVTVSNVPNGATLSAGTDNGDGTWTLAAGDVDGLTVTPADGSTDAMSLSFEVSGTGGAGDSLASENFDSGVSGWSGGATSSGGQMKLQGDTSTSKTFDFGSEHGGQTVTISFDFDAGSGWEESGQYTDYFNVSANGTEVLDTTEADSSSHSFTVTLDENGQVTLEMSTNTTASSEYMMVDNLEITAGDDWSSTLASETVDVTPDPENLVYDLDITSALTDTDGSETLSVTVDDLPDGAVLSAGTENQDGSWTLEAGDLSGLTMSVPDGSGAFNLAVSATATEADGDTNTVSASVSVAAPDETADGVTLDTSDASGSEDQAIALDIDATLVDTDGSETVSITISGVPDGATLNAGTENQDGTWTLEAGDLDGLMITPPADSNADFTLTVSATTTEESTGDTSTSTSTVDVSVAGVADAPTLSVELGTVTSTGGSDSGGPVGSITVDNPSFEADSFSDGGYSSGSGNTTGWDVTGYAGAWDAESGQFTDQGSSDGTHGVPDGENVGWAGWGGTMSQTVDGTFEADRSYELSVEVGDASGTGSPAYKIRLYAGDELVGSVDQSDFPLTDQQFTTATVTVNGSDFADDFAGFGGDLRIELVHPGGDNFVSFDTVELSAADIGGDDGYTRELDITSSLTDTDGSETLSITVSDVPDGVTLSAGTENPDGTWTLSSGDLDGLTMTVPADTADFDLSVSATATESDGNANTVTSTVSVTEPDLVSEGVTLSTSDASGSEDRAIALDIGATLTDTDGSETVSVTISGVPDGATLSAGTDNQDGTWTLDSGDLSGLTILPAEDSAADFSLTVTATATETTSGDTSTTTSTVNVTVDGIADAPELAVTLGSGTETGGGVTPAGYWNVDETSGSTFYDSIGDNDGAMHGSFDKDDSGVFGTTSAEFRPGNSNEYIEVDHSDALKPDNGAITMWFNADDVSGRNALASSDSSGNDDGGHFSLFIENGQIRLRMQGDNSEGETNLYGGSVSTGEWNQVTVTWGDDGARIYVNGEQVRADENWTRGLGGNENPWTFGANQWSSSDNVANNLKDYFDGHMDDIAIYDQQLTADQVADLYEDGVTDMMNSGDPSMEYPLTITTALADTDGSESLSITVDGLPDGATLSAGTENQDGTWSLESGDLSGLTVTVPSGSDDFMLNVSATATDEGGDTRTATQLVQFDTGDDGFDAGTTGTDSADTLTGSSGDDVISGEGGADDIDAGDGDDTVMGGSGDDIIDGGDGADLIDAGTGADTIDGGAGDDHVMGGDGDDLFIFGSGDGADYFNGGDGWSDTVQLEGVDSGPGGDSGWTLQVDEGTTYTETESGVEFDAEASGSIVLADGSELTFDNVEKLEW